MLWIIPDQLTDDSSRRHGWWLQLVLTAVLYLPGLATLPLMDRDEPRFAHATAEMMQRGSWVVPYFNSDPAMSDAERIAAMAKGKGAMEVGYRFDKPPLTYWWMRLHYALFGMNELAARLHTVVAVWLVALVCAALGRRIAGGRAGLAAGAAWILTLQVFIHGRLCVADMPLVLLVTATCWALMELLIFDPKPAPDQRFNRWHWLLWGALGLGFLAKGPIALLVPGLALVLWRLAFWRKGVAWGRLKVWPGLLIALALVAGWGIPALVETQGLFWKVGMGEHVVKRGTTAFNGRFPIPGYYLATALISLFPWVALLPQVWRWVRARWNAQAAFLTSWLVAPYVIFSLYATQLPHYVMPGFPAAMLLMAGWCPGSGGPEKRRWWTWLPVLLFFALGLAVLGGVMGFRNLIAAQGGQAWPLLAGLFALGCMLCLLALIGAGLTMRGERRRGSLVVLAIQVLLLGGSVQVLTQQIRSLHPAVQLAAKAGPLPPEVELAGWQFQEPSLIFHFDHHWKFYGKLDSLAGRMKRPGARVVVLLRREWTLDKALRDWRTGKPAGEPDKNFSIEVDQLMAAHPDYEVMEFHGFNAARASWVELRMLVRTGAEKAAPVKGLSESQAP